MRFVIYAAILLGALTAKAEQQTALPGRCWFVGTVFSATSIAAGAVTSSQFDTRSGAHGLGGGMTLLPSHIKLRVLLTDANDGVSNLRFTFGEAETTGATVSTVPVCDEVGGVFTCLQAKLDWNPQTSGNGKRFTLYPLAWQYPFGTVTVTPTGHGAGDTITVDMYGCAN